MTFSSYYNYQMIQSSKNHTKTTLLKVLITIQVVFQNAYSQQSANLLVNGDFSMDNLNGNWYYDFPLSITGWNCTKKCQIDDCYKMNQAYISWGLYNANCTGYVVDLISDDVQNLTQNVILDYDYYHLSLSYYFPTANANTKTFQIYFNQVKIFSLTPNVSFLYTQEYFQKLIEGVAGVNTLRFTTVRNSGWDTNGFFVGNIKLTKPANSVKSIVNTTILSDLALIMTKIPGSRVIFMDFMTFFINFDRLQLYYYHNRNYSQYSNLLLSDISIINDLKGLFFQTILQQIAPIVCSRVDSFFPSIDYKYQYTPGIVIQRDENGGGFVSNCYNFFVYTVPGTIVTYILLLGIFELLRKRPASRLIRKYSFFGILIPMIFEGNIQSLTYYSFGEMTLFFSENIQHRFINIFIVFFQFIITVISVGSVLFFKYHYKKLIFYLIQDKRNNHMGILCQTVDNGLICMLFGMVHQILFSRPQLQLLVLFILECTWMAFRVFLISLKAYQKNFTYFVLFNTGLIRISFIITFYFYEFAGELRLLINDAFHKGLVIAIILLWLQELIISLLQLILSFPEFFVKFGLIEGKTKQLKLKKVGLLQYVSMQMASPQIIQQSITTNERTAHKSLYKVHSKYFLNEVARKGKVFQHKKVLISQLRTNKNRIQNHFERKPK